MHNEDPCERVTKSCKIGNIVEWFISCVFSRIAMSRLYWPELGAVPSIVLTHSCDFADTETATY
jgi:hypothetical protein